MNARPLNFMSGMPNVSSALNGWMRQMTLNRVVQSVSNFGDVSTTELPFSFMGAVQPLSPQELELKPEGLRSWEWLQIHMKTPITLTLSTNDLITINGRIFKIMAKKDYSQNGYIEYHAIYDYQP